MTLPACSNRVTSKLALVAFYAAAGVAQAAEPAPNRPVRLVIASAVGGGTDTVGRIIALKVSDATGQPWVVDNRSGASGNLGAEIVARAKPDGHTALVTTSNLLTVNPSLYKLSFNVQTDLQPVTMLAMADQLLIVHPSVPARTLKEFVALAKQKPGALNFASAGVGTTTHLGAELLKNRTGIVMTHVPYQGGGPAAAAVLAGEVQLLVGSAASAMQFISSGKLRAIASTGLKRSKLTPDVPTVAESGYPGFESGVWYALMMPGSTPNNIVERIRGEVLKAMQLPDVQTAMARQDLNPAPTTPAELAARIKAETRLWEGIIKDVGIRAE